MIRLQCRRPFTPWACSACGLQTDDRAPSSVLAGLVCDVCLDAGRKGEPYIPLTVRPAAPAAKPDYRPVLAVSMAERRAVTDTGDVFDLPELVDRVRERRPGEIGAGHSLPPRHPPAIVAVDHALDLLGYLDQSPAAESPFWQFQVAIRSGGAWRPEARSTTRFLMPRPLRFGYASRRGGRVRATGRAHWYAVIEPASFCEIADGWGALDALELLRFGVELRDWANRERLPVLQAVSSYGSRLLRDARFGGGWRRKVPAATNRALRVRLPGNHYQLLGRPAIRYPAAHKWDQQMAHHHAALKSRFPHADQLDAAGWFRRPAPIKGAPFHRRGAIRAGTAQWDELTARPGVFTIAVRVPELVAIDPLQLPALRTAGRTWQTLTSVEIEQVRQHHPDVDLLDVWACWTSPNEDDRLREYSLWAAGQLAGAGRTVRRWLKPLLLASYGMLAVKPSAFRNGWRWCSRPDGAIGWQTRYGQLVGYERAGREREAAIANVAWRAIIESKVRAESLHFARELRAGGWRPLCVYADAVFATTTTPRPTDARPPWRYEGTVHDLVFESKARYRSQEETRLPGVPRRGGHQLINPRS